MIKAEANSKYQKNINKTWVIKGKDLEEAVLFGSFRKVLIFLKLQKNEKWKEGDIDEHHWLLMHLL